VQQQLQFSY